MNVSDLQAAFEKNKTAVLGVAGVGVVGFALHQRRKAATSGDAGAALSAGSQTAAASGGAAYDSTASDLYGALQPQLESIGQQLNQITNPTTVPAPAAPAPPKVVLGQPRTPVTTQKSTHIPVTIKRPAAPKPATPVAPRTITYKVLPGDNLSKIAARYPAKTITAKTIYAANKTTIGANPNVIRPGQTLVIR